MMLKTRAAQMFLIWKRLIMCGPAESHPQASSDCVSQPTVDQLRCKRISMKKKTISDELDSCMKEYFCSKIHNDGSESSQADE
ncbi:hypothetical protein PR048_018646 [Dryococelus australis]|uniref:Uncharacterized protein n=1 Tax=Dryococelus australis TaxID=614101 RepID=A0ABQ9HDL6_9NEOP|nr:hypothetical protein PR048_018646 [Dryococelus australis]